MVDLKAVIAPVSSCLGEACADDFLVLDTENGRYVGLGEVGGYIWVCFDGRRTLEELAGKVAGRYGIEVDEAASDLFEFVDQLLERGLVKIV